MEIREIIYVHTVARFKNLSKAAEELHITQPTLSQSIKNIEKKIEVQLFIRSKKGMTLTDEGKAFVNDSKDLLESYRTFLDELSSYCELGKTYHIGFHKLIHTTKISDQVMSYISENNQDNYVIKVESNDALEVMIENGQLDLAIIKYPPIYNRKPNLNYRNIYKEKLYVMLHKDHFLSKKKAIRLKDLEGIKLLTSDPSEYPNKMIEHIFKDSKVKMKKLISTNYSNMTVITDFIEKNMGITFATLDVCKYYRNKDITYIPYEPDIHYETFIVSKHLKSTTLTSLPSLIEYIKEQHSI